MTDKKNLDLLCIPHGDKYYAIELPHVVEICFDLPIRKIPRLPEYYRGICNYKGVAVPVVLLEEQEVSEHSEKKQNDIILIMQTEKYQFGILVNQEPMILSFQEGDQVEDYTGLNALNRWEEKRILQKGNDIFLLLDLEKTAENLVAYK